MRTGDTVKHAPSGERWLVAWADDASLSPCGWPESIARVSDCTLIKAATDEEYIKLLREIANSSYSGINYRRSRCINLLRQWEAEHEQRT